MGLAASQARVFLLTSENNKLELQAMMIEEERLLLSEEQETIASDYAEATSNQVYVTNTNDDTTDGEILTLENLGTSSSGGIYVIKDSSGNFICAVSSITTTDDDGNTTVEARYAATENNYRTNTVDGGWSDTIPDDCEWLNDSDVNSSLQQGLNDGTLKIYLVEDNTEGGTTLANAKMTEKSASSLSNVKQRYYTEDDAEATATYQVEMARVNRLDTQLENKLNRIETKKKAVETELESAKELVSNNIERTFGYFS